MLNRPGSADLCLTPWITVGSPAGMPWTPLSHMRVEIAVMRTPDGHRRLEISRFLRAPPIADHRMAPVNALGYLRIMSAVEDIEDTLARLRSHRAELVGERGIVRGQVPALLRPTPGGNPHRAGRADRLAG